MTVSDPKKYLEGHGIRLNQPIGSSVRFLMRAGRYQAALAIGEDFDLTNKKALDRLIVRFERRWAFGVLFPWWPRFVIWAARKRREKGQTCTLTR